jgi:hypothetical protein
MKKFLLILFATLCCAGSSFASDGATINFYNKTKSTIYLKHYYTKNSNHCRDTFHDPVKVESHTIYNFIVNNTIDSLHYCHMLLLGYTDINFAESNIAIRENFSVKFSSSGDYIKSHDTRPKECGLGMTCSTTLAKSKHSMEITATNEANQYAHLVFNNTTNYNYYVNFERKSGYCSDSLNNAWSYVESGKIKTDYITNTHKKKCPYLEKACAYKEKICWYKVSVTKDLKGKELVCNSIVGIYVDIYDHTIIKRKGGNCTTLISYNKWLANIMPDVYIPLDKNY